MPILAIDIQNNSLQTWNEWIEYFYSSFLQTYHRQY